MIRESRSPTYSLRPTAKPPTVDDIRTALRSMSLPTKGEEYVLDVATSPPSRLVGEHRNRNLIFDVPIPRLGLVLQAESGSGEYFFLLERSRDEDIVAIFDQPNAVHLMITNKRGVRTPISYTPDFLIIHDDCVVAYEVKEDSKLENLCRERPFDWVRTDDGFRYETAYRHFEKLGITHTTICNSTTSSIRAENLRLLAAVRGILDSAYLEGVRKRALRIICKERIIRLSDLLNDLGLADTTAIFQLVDARIVHADLDTTLLTSIRGTWICASNEEANALTRSRARALSCLQAGEAITTDTIAHPRHLVELTKRLETCEGPLGGNKSDPEARSARSARRYREALRRSGGDIRSLFPKWEKCGNHTLRKSQQHYDFLHQVIHDSQANKDHANPAHARRVYLALLKTHPVLHSESPLARSTIYRHWRCVHRIAESAGHQGGRRLRNLNERPIDPSKRALVPTRAFSIAHVDHWQADIELIVCTTESKTVTQRPWVTGIVDSYSGEVLALWVSFRTPCRESCAMAIRCCVLRHGRVPEVLIMDGGPDFESVHYAVMLASLQITRSNRPPVDPRFGKEVERVFGSFKELFLRGMPGFIPGIKYTRRISGSHAPKRRAKLDLSDFVESIEHYAYGCYNHAPKPEQLESRHQLRCLSDSNFPFSGRPVAWNKAFLILTSIEAPDETYTLYPNQGVRVLGRLYTNEAILDYRGFKKDVDLRVDPFDSSIVYVCLESKWHVCRSRDSIVNNSISDLEVISKSTKYYQLRAIRNMASDEASVRAYTAKLELLSRKCLGSTKSITRTKQVNQPQANSNNQPSLDQIDDLMFDGPAP